MKNFICTLIKIAILLLPILGEPTLLYAQTEDVDITVPAEHKEPSNRPVSRWQWSLMVVNRTGYRINEPRVLQMSRSYLDVKGIYKISDQWRLTLQALGHYDPVTRLGFSRKPSLQPREILLDGKIGQISLSLGLQQIVWGQADGLRVLDIINPLDYREFILEDFLDSRRPLWAIRADLPIEKGSLQLVWIPYFAPGKLPRSEDEFGLGESFGLGLLGAAFKNLPATQVETAPSQRPGYQLSASQFGLRYSHSVRGWDVTANYFYGWEDIPTPYLKELQLFPTVKLKFAPRFDRKTILGTTAATNFGPVVFRFEAGVSLDKAAAVISPNSTTGFKKYRQFSSVVGLDYSPKSWLWLSGQYFLQFVSAPQQNLLLPRYHHLASFYLRTNFLRDTLKPELFVLTGLNQKEYLIRPKITKSIGDHWKIGLGIDLLGGNSTTPFGFFRSRDRAVIELRYLR
ncbi:MAG: DUF1302 family protein [Acidobacteriota bacterium]